MENKNYNYNVDDILAEIKSRNVNEHERQFMCSSTRLRSEGARNGE